MDWVDRDVLSRSGCCVNHRPQGSQVLPVLDPAFFCVIRCSGAWRCVFFVAFISTVRPAAGAVGAVGDVGRVSREGGGGEAAREREGEDEGGEEGKKE